MSELHLHLLVNHIPILGTLFALVLGAYGALRKQPEVVRAAVLAMVVSGVFSIAAMRTGEGAEERVEHLPGISERIIHEHEEAAEAANIAAVLLALSAVGVLAWRRKKPDLGVPATVVLLAGAVVVFGLMARTGNLGGQIRHAEIRDGGATPAASGGAVRSEAEHGEYDDD